MRITARMIVAVGLAITLAWAIVAPIPFRAVPPGGATVFTGSTFPADLYSVGAFVMSGCAVVLGSVILCSARLRQRQNILVAWIMYVVTYLLVGPVAAFDNVNGRLWLGYAPAGVYQELRFRGPATVISCAPATLCIETRSGVVAGYGGLLLPFVLGPDLSVGPG